jgi:hypothetical protein
LGCERQITVVNELEKRTRGDLFGLQIENAKIKWKVESYGTGAGSKSKKDQSSCSKRTHFSDIGLK